MGLLQKKMCEINGVRYMAPSVAADLWGISTQKVTYACGDGRIESVDKDTSGKWIIPVDVRQPLEKEVIRSLLISILWLKNRPDTSFTEVPSEDIFNVFDYLYKTKYIEAFKNEGERIPYNVILTDRGMKLATEGTTTNINWMNAGLTLTGVIADVITIWGAAKGIIMQ